MKVQRISLSYKIGSAKINHTSSSRVIPANNDEVYISRDTKKLQARSEANQIYSNTGTEVSSPRTYFLNPAYSRENDPGDINSLKSFSRSNSPRLLSTNRDKSTNFSSGIREEKIKKAKIKLAQGYYSRSEVYSKVAEQIIDVLI